MVCNMLQINNLNGTWVIPRCGHYIQSQKLEFETPAKPLYSQLSCWNLCIELL